MRRLVWLTCVTTTLAIGAIVSLFGIIGNDLHGYKGDWLIFWFVAKAPVTALYHDLEKFPFPYPPSALFLVKPFGLFDPWVAFALWSAAGLGLIVAAARKIAPWPAIVAATAMPALLGCVVTGQTSLFVGALVIAGVAGRSWMCGLAAVIKPQALFGLPVAVVATGKYRRVIVIGLISTALIVLTVVLWGVQPWLDWFGVLDDFKAQLHRRHIDEMDVGMRGLILWLGLPSLFYFVGAALGAATIFATFRGTDSPLDRYAALASGSVLISPYTLGYDLAGLSIAAATILWDQRRSVKSWVASGLLLSGAAFNVGVIALAATLLWEHRVGVRRLAWTASPHLP